MGRKYSGAEEIIGNLRQAEIMLDQWRSNRRVDRVAIFIEPYIRLSTISNNQG
jgi:hypothetical protein